MLTKEQILADATERFAELNKILVGAELPPFPIETAYVNLDDDLNGDDAIVTKWFNETMDKTQAMIAAIPHGDGFHAKLLQAKLQLKFIETICDIHTRLVKLLINAEFAAHTLH